MNIKNNITNNSDSPISTSDTANTKDGMPSSSNTTSDGLESIHLDSNIPAPKAAELEQDSASKSTKEIEPKRSSGSKKTANQNALTHGVFSNEITLPWESPADFEKLHAAFKDDWKPCGCSEETAVLDLTHWTWIKWRATRMAQVHYYQDPFGLDIIKSEKMSWQDILRNQTVMPEIAESALKLTSIYISGLNDMLNNLRKRAYPTDTTDGKRAQSELSRLGNDVNVFIQTAQKDVIPAVKKLVKLTERTSSVFTAAYEPETIEQQVKVMAMIDARIDKMLVRLTSLKEYKRMSELRARPSHLVEGPSIVPAIDTTPKK